MARKQRANVATSDRLPDKKRVHREPVGSGITDGRTGGMLAWLIALLIARWLIPTEAAADGMTLWIVQLVLITAVGRIIWLRRTGQSINRFDSIDGAIGLLVAGQVVSAMGVVLTVGNQRGAINVAWEWIGSGVLIWLIRQELKSTRIVREVCLGLTLTGAILAGYGMYQHYIWYPQMVREYDRMVSEMKELTSARSGDDARTLSASEARRLAKLQSEMTQQGIPLDESARKMWDSRLKGSSEPLGLFALANSFAGLLLVLLLVALGGGLRDGRVTLARHTSQERTQLEAECAQETTKQGTSLFVPRLRVGLVWVCVGALGFCLILSKCRTAMFGLVAGLSWWGCRRLVEYLATNKSSRFSNLFLNRLFVRSVLVGAAIIGVGVAAASLSGGLDVKVVTESSKSLRYRFEFWQGTWATIREHLWFGTGPANFRDYYLAHKLSESSEEIADPHNMILDVWANAGLLGLSGLVVCVMLMARTWTARQSERDTDDDVRRMQSEQRLTSTAIWGAGLAFPLAAIGTEFLGFGLDERLWWLGGIWWLSWLLLVVWKRQTQELDHVVQTQSTSVAYALEAGNIALLVHLLGAGGIAMPAILQLLLLVWVLRAALAGEVQEIDVTSGKEAVIDKSDSLSSTDQSRIGELDGETSSSGFSGKCVWSEPVKIGVLVAAVLASGLCLWTGTLPELTCRTALELGDAAWLEHRNFDVAISNYAKAAEVDRFSLEPLERTASLFIQHAYQTETAKDYEAAARRQQVLIDRIPFSPHPYRSLGQLWLTRYEKTLNQLDAQRAAIAFEAAVKRYPHHAMLLSEWAFALMGAGQTSDAQEAVRRALVQDDVNHQAGHIDKYLDAASRERLERMVETKANEAN